MQGDWQSFWSHQHDPRYGDSRPEFAENHGRELTIRIGDPTGRQVLELGCSAGTLYPIVVISRSRLFSANAHYVSHRSPASRADPRRRARLSGCEPLRRHILECARALLRSPNVAARRRERSCDVLTRRAVPRVFSAMESGSGELPSSAAARPWSQPASTLRAARLASSRRRSDRRLVLFPRLPSCCQSQ